MTHPEDALLTLSAQQRQAWLRVVKLTKPQTDLLDVYEALRSNAFDLDKIASAIFEAYMDDADPTEHLAQAKAAAQLVIDAITEYEMRNEDT